jgi:hypothetical protein
MSGEQVYFYRFRIFRREHAAMSSQNQTLLVRDTIPMRIRPMIQKLLSTFARKAIGAKVALAIPAKLGLLETR